MRSHEFITELDLALPAGVQLVPVSDYFSEARWKDKTGATVQVYFQKLSSGNVADFGFRRSDPQGNLTIGRTNTGGAAASNIFGQVAAIVQEYLAKNPSITHLTFGASDDPARSKLYSRMAQRAGAIGMELVNPADKANMPPILQQQQRNLKYQNATAQLPTKNANSPYTKKYDQFVLKRQGLAPLPKQGMTAPNRAGDEYTNMYGGKPTAFDNQQYLKDLTAKQQQFPNDTNLSAELSSLSKRVPQP
jgi:hypothetical protein